MDKEKLFEELKPYSIDELKLIVSTQQDLYSPEEMNAIREMIDSKEKMKKLDEEKQKIEQEKYIKEHLPKEIICPKCDGINPFENEKCCYCEYKLDKSKYYKIEYYEKIKEIEEAEANLEDEADLEDENTQSYTFQYVISFLIPLVGYILGAILLSKENPEEKSVGKKCIILGIVSTIVSVVISLISVFIISKV